ncbi:MAG: type IX secretion system outer membrane channel protein PorV [Ginsengibacter sp.]
MKNIKKILFTTAALLGISSAGIAQQTQKIDIVTTAVPFLRISPDARTGGMGETGIAISPDANAQFYNVARYPFATAKSGLGMTYTPWLKNLGLNDVYLASLAGYYKLDENQAISGSFKYFSLGNLQLTDHNGNDLYTQKPREISVDAGYSRKLSERLSLGLEVRYINSNLVGNSTVNGVTYKTGNAFAADLGLYYTTVKETTGGWSAGAVFSNLGSKISYTSDAGQKSFLPANFGIGAGYTWITNEVHKISVNGEINKLLVAAPPGNGSEEEYRKYNEKGLLNSWVNSLGNKAVAYSAGCEYIYNNQFSARAGYYTDSRNMGKRNYFTTGVGIDYNMFGINFSYLIPSSKSVGLNPLSNTLRFSLVVKPITNK